MSYNWMAYDPATGCVPHSAGAKALAAYLEDRFPYQYSGGICNCRNVNGGSSWSHHAECRAYDCMIPTGSNGSYRPELGDPIIELLGPHGRRLGLDHFILNRVIYSATSPDGRYYSGRHPHYNHAHIGLNTVGATNLTYATLVAVLGEPGEVEVPTYRTVLNVPDKDWAKGVVDRSIDKWGTIVTTDDPVDDWENLNMTDGRFWTMLDRALKRLHP